MNYELYLNTVNVFILFMRLHAGEITAQLGARSSDL